MTRSDRAFVKERVQRCQLCGGSENVCKCVNKNSVLDERLRQVQKISLPVPEIAGMEAKELCQDCRRDLRMRKLGEFVPVDEFVDMRRKKATTGLVNPLTIESDIPVLAELQRRYRVNG